MRKNSITYSLTCLAGDGIVFFDARFPINKQVSMKVLQFCLSCKNLPLAKIYMYR